MKLVKVKFQGSFYSEIFSVTFQLRLPNCGAARSILGTELQVTELGTHLVWVLWVIFMTFTVI